MLPQHMPGQREQDTPEKKPEPLVLPLLRRHACLTTPERVKESPSDIGATSKEKNNIVIPEFSAWLTLVLEQCRAENIRNLPRQRAPTPLFPERRPREACSMPISGCHDLPLVTFNLPSRNNLQNKPNSAATLWRHACLTTPEHVKESPNPPNPSCCRSRGGKPCSQHMPGQREQDTPEKKPEPLAAPPAAAVAWPVHRPTHAPATTLKTNGNSAPPPPKTTPRAVTLWRHACLTTPVVKPSLPQRLPVQPQKNPPPSSFRNFHSAQAEGKRPESPPQGGASHRSCGCAVAKRLHGRGEAAWPSFSELRQIPRPPRRKCGRKIRKESQTGRLKFFQPSEKFALRRAANGI